jgi:dTMP kinase
LTSGIRQGRFITIEGVEGVGKSTSATHIESILVSRGLSVLVTREPGGTTVGERVREILLDKTEQQMTAVTELLLMFASRVQHVEEVIKPALDRGQWVISDRFTDSSYAYQGGGRGIDKSEIAQLESLTLKNFRPDLTLVLDLEVEEGLRRAAKVASADRFESEQRVFFERVRSAFLDKAATSNRYRVVDASKPLEIVESRVTEILEEFLERVC